MTETEPEGNAAFLLRSALSEFEQRVDADGSVAWADVQRVIETVIETLRGETLP